MLVLLAPTVLRGQDKLIEHRTLARVPGGCPNSPSTPGAIAAAAELVFKSPTYAGYAVLEALNGFAMHPTLMLSDVLMIGYPEVA